VQWDPLIGGQTMEMRLVDYFADEFRNQTGIDIRNNPKAMAKLKKQVKRTKHILSANTEAPLSVEALHEDLDFRCSLTYCLFFHLRISIFFRSNLFNECQRKCGGLDFFAC
jgi:hypoxia up-regulated 1